MKIICTKSNLSKGVSIVSKAVPSKTTMPILECILIDASTDVIKLTANDIYIPLNSLGENAENVEGTIYRLNKVFEIRKSGRKDIRVWKETVLAQHVCKGKQISSRSMYIDSLKEDIVFLA